MDPVRFLARRLVRVGAQIVPLCAAILVVALIDPTDTNTFEKTMRTVTNTLTYTNNLLYQHQPAGAREDMGHLWFLSIQLQWYLLLPLLVLLLAGAALFAALVASTAVGVDGLPGHHGVGQHVVRARSAPSPGPTPCSSGCCWPSPSRG